MRSHLALPKQGRGAANRIDERGHPQWWCASLHDRLRGCREHSFNELEPALRFGRGLWMFVWLITEVVKPTPQAPRLWISARCLHGSAGRGQCSVVGGHDDRAGGNPGHRRGEVTIALVRFAATGSGHRSMAIGSTKGFGLPCNLLIVIALTVGGAMSMQQAARCGQPGRRTWW